MSSKIKLFIALAIAAIFLVTAGYYAYVWQRFLSKPVVPPGQSVHYVIKPGTSIIHLAWHLHRLGYLEEPKRLISLAELRSQTKRIQAGEYSIEGGTKPTELLDKLVAGKVVPHYITIIEGWTFDQLIEALNSAEGIKHTLARASKTQIMQQLGQPGAYPEGLFFPETYRYRYGIADIELLKRAHQLMVDKIKELWLNRSAEVSYANPYEAITLASIIEREAALPHEQQQVAGVLVKRLQKKMRLQVDASVIYGLGRDYKGDIKRKHLRKNTPYNTYLHQGLPPTPIAMPGYGALYAALHPTVTDALYYVSRGDGSHQFSATLKEQNAAVLKYQLKGIPRKTLKSKLNRSQTAAEQSSKSMKPSQSKTGVSSKSVTKKQPRVKNQVKLTSHSKTVPKISRHSTKKRTKNIHKKSTVHHKTKTGQHHHARRSIPKRGHSTKHAAC